MSEKPSRMLEVLVEMGVFELFFPKMNSNNASLLGDIDLAANHQLNLSQRCAVLLSSLNVEDINAWAALWGIPVECRDHAVLVRELQMGLQSATLEPRNLLDLLNRVDVWVLHHRKFIYGFISIILVVSVYGLTKIQAVGYIVDDLPRDNAIYSDLKFVENRFKGVMPFEINIDAFEKGRALSPELLAKIKRTEKLLAKYPAFTQGLSILTATKYLYQVYRGGDPKYFTLPGIDELAKLKDFQSSLNGNKNNLFVIIYLYFYLYFSLFLEIFFR